MAHCTDYLGKCSRRPYKACIVIEQNVLQISIRPTNMLFKSLVALLIFCLPILPVIETGLKSLVIIVCLSISPSVLSAFASCITKLRYRIINI